MPLRSQNTNSDLLFELRRQWDLIGNRGAMTRLWITCDDAAMDPAVQMIRQSGRDLVARLPGGIGGRPGSSMADILRTIEHFPISDLILCGHASCSAVPQPPQQPRGRGDDPLLGGVRQRMARNERGRQHLVQQLAAVLAVSQEAAGGEDPTLGVSGLFFLEESATFTLYDWCTDRFVPITS